MHFLILSFVIYLAIKKAKWNEWEQYYPTMLYMSLASFLYEYISHTHYHLWELETGPFISHMNVHFLHNLIINPLIAFIFLSNYPTIPFKKFLYILRWVLIFFIGEWFGRMTEILTYHHGWNLAWSFLFIIIMFPMIRFHYIYPIRALFLSVFFVIFFLEIFHYI
ncbi:CBO0543 family protein [Metabacillus litoralis]|uniref:CBO0543 family protein n=1 Tax=Metabacillus TaxID=2675233 RepID=UPI000EF5D107|nr:CBO0543 family protein [Metabacillus litoralis]MCM3162963.1 hypothetical protein [Metabacillus litoralis]MCM3410669.1 hypothetical protein [Metabacillus litoralis]